VPHGGGSGGSVALRTANAAPGSRVDPERPAAPSRRHATNSPGLEPTLSSDPVPACAEPPSQRTRLPGRNSGRPSSLRGRGRFEPGGCCVDERQDSDVQGVAAGRSALRKPL